MIKFIIGVLVGAIISLFLYACILACAKSEQEVIENENSQNRN